MILDRGQSTHKEPPPPPYIEVSAAEAGPSGSQPGPHPPNHFESSTHLPFPDEKSSRGHTPVSTPPPPTSTSPPPPPPSTSPPPSPPVHSTPSTGQLVIPSTNRISNYSTSSSVSSRSQTSHSVALLEKALDSGKGKWFHSKKRTAKEVRATALQVIGNLVRNYGKHLNDPAAEPVESILANCATACASASIDLSELLQEKSVEGHAPIYWAIVTHTSDLNRHFPSRLIYGIMRHSAPLNDVSRAEIRTACLSSNNPALFDFIRQTELFTPRQMDGELMSGSDSFQPDVISIEESVSAGFTVHFELMHFMKRMHSAHDIALEFIAKARMWRLTFVADPKNKNPWQVSLSLLDTSSPTFVDSQLHVLDASPYPVVMSSPQSPTISSTSKPLPDIMIVMNSQSQLISLDAKPSRGFKHEIVIPLSSPETTSLLTEGSNYISSDGIMRARLDMQLVKPEKESSCIIC